MESILQEKSFMTLMIMGILIMLAFALAFVLFVNYSQKKILKKQMQIQKLDYEHQEELLHATILTQEKERHRIAKDLHDDIGSKLNIIFLNICRLKKHEKAHEDIGAITEEVTTVINTTIDSIRYISHELLPPTLEGFGLAETIRELQHSFNTAGHIHIDFITANTENKIDNSLIELNLFRVLQELINNSIKHGKATEISINLSVKESVITFFYTDNGVGFDSTKMETKKGLGMKNIESRMRIINATYQLTSSLEEGTQVAITIPHMDQTHA
jgi:signal transduction histidine kinase